ncbi:hypothetical protein BH23PSE2_BH23PSE2_02240 [soil metagenome]
MNRCLFIAIVAGLAVASVADVAAVPPPAVVKDQVVIGRATAVAQKVPAFNNNMTVAEVLAAQATWGDALVAISLAYREGGIEAARNLANQALDSAYGYDLGPVLFKPTLAWGERTFRVNRQGALAYFVGHDPAYPDDSGFALKDWASYRNDNAAIFIEGQTATVMGQVHLTTSDGSVTTVDKTWQYRKDDKGRVRIVTHHSSIPYQPPGR